MLSAKLYLLRQVFIINLLNSLKPAWYSNFSKLSVVVSTSGIFSVTDRNVFEMTEKNCFWARMSENIG